MSSYDAAPIGQGEQYYEEVGGLLDFIREHPKEIGLTAGLLAPGAGSLDAVGLYPDPLNSDQYLPGISDNLRNWRTGWDDALLQALSLGGDMAVYLSPFTGPAAPVVAAAGASMAVPRTAQVASQLKRLRVKPEVAQQLKLSGKPEQAAPGTWYSRLSRQKHVQPIEEYSALWQPSYKLKPRKRRRPSDLEGGVLFPLTGDRTATGYTLKEINEQPLAFDVGLEGGPNFMRGPSHAADKAYWASEYGAASKLANKTRELANEYDDVYGMYVANANVNSDFATMTSDAIMAMMPGAPVTKKAKQAFDKDFREILNRTLETQGLQKSFSKWPGIDSPYAQAWLDSVPNGYARVLFAKTMNKTDHAANGFPDVGAVRFALTEPDLLGHPTGVAGYNIAKPDPRGLLLTDPTVPHKTYNTQLGGGYWGSFDYPLPLDVAFPDFYKLRRKMGKPERSDKRAFDRSKVHQEATPEWVDNAEKYIEQEKKRKGR